MSQKQRFLILYRSSAKFTAQGKEPLASGVRGNLQTLSYMAQFVRETYFEDWLTPFLYNAVLEPNQSQADKVTAIFEFCRDKIKFVRDVPGVERVADLRSILQGTLDFEPYTGDCVFKSVAMATMLAAIGEKPVFIVLKSSAKTTNFNHVYAGIIRDGKIIPLDATPPEFRPGNELAGLKASYRIF